MVCRSIGSMLGQTFQDLELIMVFEPNDPAAIIVRREFRDQRLVIIENETKLGRSESYNLGLRQARGRYLVRMDADDYSYPERLERQIAFLRTHPEVAVIGSNVQIVGENGQFVGIRNFPANHADIMKSLTFINPMCHPTIVWDRDQVGYDVQFDLRFSRFCDDLELWMRLMVEGHRFANLPDILLDYQQINEHRRPRENWRLNYQARLLHWRLGFWYPRLFFGLLSFRILSLLPDGIINLLTKRSWFSDKFRHVHN